MRKIQKPLRPKAVKVSDEWDSLSFGLDAVFSATQKNLSFEELYRNAYNIVTAKSSALLYSNTQELMANHLKKSQASLLNLSFQDWLTNLTKIYSSYLISCEMCRDLLMYLDRTWVKEKGLPKVYDMGLNTFRETIIDHPQIKQKLLDGLVSMISQERRGELIHVSLMKQAIEMLLGISCASSSSLKSAATVKDTVYHKEFEPVYLAETEKWYKTVASDWISTCTSHQYLLKVQQAIDTETQRISSYLSPSSTQKLHLVLRSTLLLNYCPQLIHNKTSGLLDMISKDNIQALKDMYTLFIPISGAHDEMAKTCADFLLYLGHARHEPSSNPMLGVISDAKNIADLNSLNAFPTTATDHEDPKSDATNAIVQSEQSKVISKNHSLAEVSENGTAAVMSTTPSSASLIILPSNAEKCTWTATPLEWVDQIISLKDKFYSILSNSFANDQSFSSKINESLQKVVNLSKNAPELACLFVDDFLRRTSKQSSKVMTDQPSTNEFDVCAEKTIIIFKFLQEKDVFERYYKQHLAKRLLNLKNIVIEFEQQMVARIKLESGHLFTSKLEGIFNDVEISTELSKAFKLSQSKVGTGVSKIKIELGVHVLTSTFWPFVPPSTPLVRYPPEFLEAIQAFSAYYLSKHTGRKLSWIPNLGSVDLRANLNSGQREVNVSLFGAVVLLAFNKSDHTASPVMLSFSQLLESLQMSKSDLIKTLTSLVCGKYKILRKKGSADESNSIGGNSKPSKILTTDEYEFNSSFTTNLSKIKIASVSSKSQQDSAQEQSETLSRIQEERKHHIEACIVRIMKSRKSLVHAILVSSVIEQLAPRFCCDPAQIKSRIESLIEREYLERSDTDRNLYIYMA